MTNATGPRADGGAGPTPGRPSGRHDARAFGTTSDDSCEVRRDVARPHARPARARWRGERGASDVVGLALLAPAALGLALVLLFLSRQVDGRATAQSAAEAAAQAAAQERTPSDAVRAARTVGAAMLVDESTCASPTVLVDVSRFLDPIAGVVAVEVRCTTSTAGLEPIGAPEGRTHGATAWATVDPFRGSGG